MYQAGISKKARNNNSHLAGRESVSGAVRKGRHAVSCIQSANQPRQFFYKNRGYMDEIENLPQINRTGLPDGLKSGMERLSGLSLDDVRVHYNSARPARFQALAYTQGTDIHIGPGQEKHLAHEAWHVIQQKQGRVRPNMEMHGMAVNDDAGLEHEADVMGRRAVSLDFHRQIQRKRKGNCCIQRKIKYCETEFDGTINVISRNGYLNDGMLKKFYSDYNQFKSAMEDIVNVFDLDEKLKDFDDAVVIKIEKDFQPREFFVVDMGNPRTCYICKAQSRVRYSEEQYINEAMDRVYNTRGDNKMSNLFRNYHFSKIWACVRRDYKVLSGRAPANGEVTGKSQSRFEYKMENKEIKTSGEGTHYIYRSMDLACAKELERYWNAQPKPLPREIPADLNIQNIGMAGHMGNFDQAFCVYHQGTPVEFEMEQNVTPDSLAVCTNITGREREASSREGIKTDHGKLGVKTEREGGNFSFGLPAKIHPGRSYGIEAKQVVWNFLRKVKNIKVYYVRPERLN